MRGKCYIAKRKTYHKKYDHLHIGTVAVFNTMYSIIKEHGIVSNMIACCGRDLERYIGYAKMICNGTTTRAKVFFIEYFQERFLKLSKQLASSECTKLRTGLKTELLLGNVTCYEDLQNYTFTRPCRVEDLGIGMGIREMVAIGCYRLFKQSGLCNRDHWKAQILASSIRQISSTTIVKQYQKYLSTLGLKLKSVNGFKVVNPYEAKEAFNPKNATILFNDGKKKHRVYQHKIELWESNREATLYMFTITNGSQMLQSLLIYK